MLYNQLDNSPRSKWNAQVHYARHAYKMDCIDSRPNYPLINVVMKGVGDITQLRIHLAVIPVITTLQVLEQQFGCLKEKR